MEVSWEAKNGHIFISSFQLKCFQNKQKLRFRQGVFSKEKLYGHLFLCAIAIYIVCSLL